MISTCTRCPNKYNRNSMSNKLCHDCRDKAVKDKPQNGGTQPFNKRMWNQSVNDAEGKFAGFKQVQGVKGHKEAMVAMSELKLPSGYKLFGSVF